MRHFYNLKIIITKPLCSHGGLQASFKDTQRFFMAHVKFSFLKIVTNLRTITIKAPLIILFSFLFDVPAFSQCISLGAAANYAVLGVNGADVELAAVTVNGPVGVSSGGILNIAGASTVNGDIFLATNVTYTNKGTVTGTVNQPFDMVNATADANSFSTIAAALTPTQTFTTWNSSLTINGNGGLNVVQVGSVNLSGKSTAANVVVLNGTPTDCWIINVTGNFNMTGTAVIKGGSNTDASRILINVVGTGNQITTEVGNRISGTVIALKRDIVFHSVSGAVIGGQLIKLMSGAVINYVPYIPLPVHSINLTGALDHQSVNLNWTVIDQDIASYYLVERSTDGKNFTKVAKIAATGNTTGTVYYSIKDDVSTLRLQQTAFYRIKAVDTDGKYIYSKVVMIHLVSNGVTLAWPNPFTNRINVNYYAVANSSVEMLLIDDIGRQVLKQAFKVQKGNNFLSVTIPKTTHKGTYYLSIIDIVSNSKFTQKMQK